MGQKMNGFRLLAVGVLTFGLLVAFEERAAARNLRPHFHSGVHLRHFQRPHFHSGVHHRRHFHRHSRSFFGFGLHFYGYPYYPHYYPYYYPYEPGEHRRFPAFRMPGFFHYPGALGKGEEASQAFQPGAPGAETREEQVIGIDGRVTP